MAKPLRLALFLAGIFLLSSSVTAMPSAADISNVESLVNELLPANAKPAERAAAAENLAPQAETEAAKFLLLRIAFQSYVKGGEYEKAEGAFDSLLSQVPDYPVDDQDELFAKALYPLSNKTALNLRSRHSVIKTQVKKRAGLKRIQSAIKKNPANKSLYTQLGETHAILNDWPSALSAFTHSPDPILVSTATHELSLSLSSPSPHLSSLTPSLPILAGRKTAADSLVKV